MERSGNIKFLLAAVNAKYIHSNPAIYSLRAYAGKELQPCVELAEYTINQSMQDILADIYARRPDAVGFSCYIWNWRLIEELLRELPKLLPETELWLGGPEASYGAEKILESFRAVRGIMIGEGEATFRELLQIYAEGQGERPAEERLRECPGLCLREGFTAPRELVDMSRIPFLYENLEPFENRIIYYETSRGCPFQCSYCLSSIDRQVRFRDIDVVKKELQFFLEHQVKQVKFVDRTFNCSREHAMEIWRYLHEHDNGVTNFHFEISADILREEELALLGRLRPGLVQLEIGVQSVNPKTLKAICRVTDVERLEKIVGTISAGENIHQHLDLIAGLPYEGYESFGHSFDRVYAMKPQQLQLGFLKVLKGSPMHEKAEKYGIRYLEGPPYEVLYTKWLSYKELQQLKGVEELVELYYNSSQYTCTLAFLEKAFLSPFQMFEAMAAYFREKNYFLNSPARVRRYEILLDFAGRYDGRWLEAYRELLTFDLYLRENLKTRPAFACDLKGCKEQIREFYAEEEQSGRYLPDYRGFDSRQLSRMTHLEPFSYPVWDLEGMLLLRQEFTQGSFPHRQACDTWVLFDYRRRSPLTHQAAAFPVTLEGDAAAVLEGEGTDA